MNIPIVPLDPGGLYGPQLVSRKKAAEAVQVHPNTISNATARGQLRAYRYGARCVRYDLADVYALFTPYVGGEFGVWQTVR
jgi:hypothetical protein